MLDECLLRKPDQSTASSEPACSQYTQLSNVCWAELQSIGLILEDVLAEQVFTSDVTREQKHQELTKFKTKKVTWSWSRVHYTIRWKRLQEKPSSVVSIKILIDSFVNSKSLRVEQQSML